MTFAVIETRRAETERLGAEHESAISAKGGTMTTPGIDVLAAKIEWCLNDRRLAIQQFALQTADSMHALALAARMAKAAEKLADVMEKEGFPALTSLSDEIAVLKEREGVMRDALTDAESKLRILADVAEDVRLEGAPMIRQCADNARAALTDKAGS